MKKWGFLHKGTKLEALNLNVAVVTLISYYEEDIGVLYEYLMDADKLSNLRSLIKVEIYYPSLY